MGAVYRVDKLEALPEVARQLLEKLPDQRLWLFVGEMGSGKTSLIRALCRELKIMETITSPTFTLLHSYTYSEHFSVHHADLYRIQTEESLVHTGIEDYIHGPDYCFVEWADKFPHYWPWPQCWVHIQRCSEYARTVSLHSSYLKQTMSPFIC